MKTEKVETGSGSETDTTTDINTEAPVPVASNIILQNGSTQAQTLTVPTSLTDVILLRGDTIQDYLSDTGEINLCAVIYYPGSTSQKVMVLPAIGLGQVIPSEGRKEYYFRLETNNTTLNNAICNTTGITTYVFTNYQLSTFALTLNTVCPSCPATLPSSQFALVDTSGTRIELSKIDTRALALNLAPVNDVVIPGASCTKTSDCTAKGLDCCIQGQCAKEGQTKLGVDTTTTFYQYLQTLITNDPNAYKLYPQFFYICPEEGSQDASDSDGYVPDPDAAARKRLTTQSDLRNCVTTDYDEVAICTKTVTNAKNVLYPNGEGAAASGTVISVEVDDLNFSTLSPIAATRSSIVEIEYAEEVLYRENYPGLADIALPATITLSGANDNFTSAAGAAITALAGTKDDTLYIRYTVDGSCKSINTLLSQCTKTYYQDTTSTPARASDHDNSQVYQLPSYVDSTKIIRVKVGGTEVAPSATTYSYNSGTQQITFVAGYVKSKQRVDITYYTSDATTVAAATTSKKAAQSQINTICGCQDVDDCSLSQDFQTINGQSTLVGYTCTYGTNSDANQRLQDTYFVSSKMAPMRYFDRNGAAYDDDTSRASAPAQESFNTTETGFSYSANNYNRPNNVTTYIGPNEVYGNFSVIGTNPATDKIIPVGAARPPQLVTLIKGRTYDIFADTGVFSQCPTCGPDVYSGVQGLFPSSFPLIRTLFNPQAASNFKVPFATGYTPDYNENRKFDNRGPFRADDLLYGRACFVPLTMIPWTHQSLGTSTLQRRGRLSAQHLLHANGYMRDWYGFDYGALIGSFDGVTWFAIGSQRRITAKGNRLYLAVNAFHSDLTTEDSYKVVINELTPVAFSGSAIENDLDSDGALCQQAHLCDDDIDCTTKLGPDYVCSSVTDLKTRWPTFDKEAQELVTTDQLTSLAAILGGTNGNARRCVYRGRGAPCHRGTAAVAFNSVNSNDDSKSELIRCAPNYYCADINSASFNLSTSRFARTPASQNRDTLVTGGTLSASDIFGHASRILGRPLLYKPTNSLNAGDTAIGYNNLVANGIEGICMPGREPPANLVTSPADTQDDVPSADAYGDRINSIGVTDNGVAASATNLLACPAVDSNENNIHFKSTAYSATDRRLIYSQNTSTNILSLLSNASSILTSAPGEQIQTFKFDQNSCSRMPGAPCFTDLECFGNAEMTTFLRRYSFDATSMPLYNREFLREEYTCGQIEERQQAGSQAPNISYSLPLNRCCRPIGERTTTYTKNSNANYTITGGFPEVMGVDQAIAETSTTYLKAQIGLDQTSPALESADATTTQTLVGLQNQFLTLSKINERSCCGGHWVRNFARGNDPYTDSTDHTWSFDKFQNFAPEILNTIAWNENLDPTNETPFKCGSDETTSGEQDAPGSENCEIRSETFKNASAGSLDDNYLQFFRKLELLGIPQIAIETRDHQDIRPRVRANTTNGTDQTANSAPPYFEFPFVPSSAVGVIGAGTDQYVNGDSLNFYNSSVSTTFTINERSSNYRLKAVFSAKDFSCCKPTGANYSIQNTTASDCCTGVAVGVDSNNLRCCLPDYTDVTLYLNRYVSSEAQDLDDSLFDPQTGYLESIQKTYQLANLKNICCSGQVPVQGELIQPQLLIPQIFDTVQPQALERYILDRDDRGYNFVQDFKVRWPNHLYCVPQGIQLPSQGSGNSATGS